MKRLLAFAAKSPEGEIAVLQLVSGWFEERIFDACVCVPVCGYACVACVWVGRYRYMHMCICCRHKTVLACGHVSIFRPHLPCQNKIMAVLYR